MRKIPLTLQQSALHLSFACVRRFGAGRLHRLSHEHDFGPDLHRELAGQLRANDNARPLVVIEIGPLDDPLGNQGHGPLLLGNDSHNADANGVGCGTQQSGGQQPGTDASRNTLSCASVRKNASVADTTPWPEATTLESRCLGTPAPG